MPNRQGQTLITAGLIRRHLNLFHNALCKSCADGRCSNQRSTNEQNSSKLVLGKFPCFEPLMFFGVVLLVVFFGPVSSNEAHVLLAENIRRKHGSLLPVRVKPLGC